MERRRPYQHSRVSRLRISKVPVRLRRYYDFVPVERHLDYLMDIGIYRGFGPITEVCMHPPTPIHPD